MLINIRANWQGAKNGMNSVLNHAKGIGGKLSGAFSAAKNALGSVAGMMGMGMGAAAAVTGVKKLIDKMDEIEDNAPKLGVTFAYFQKMQFAAERTGTSFGAVTSGLTRVKKLSGEAAAGMKSGTDAFNMIGMSVKDLAGKDAGQIFDEVTQRLNAIEDPLLRDAAATQFFGKNFTELNNFIKDHIALGNELEARGGIISDEHILAASAYKDSISNIGFSLQAWAVNSGFITQLAQIAEGLDAIYSNAKKMEKNGIKTGTEEYDANEGGMKKTARRLLNAATFSGLSYVMGKDQMKLGDKLFGRPEEKLHTAAIDRNSPEYKAKNAAFDAGKNRAKEVNAAVKSEAAISAAVTARSRASEVKALEDAQAKAKVTPKTALAKAQAAMTSGATSASAAKITSDSLQRIGGYSGGMKASQALDVAKKQVDILSQVDKKLAVLEAAARDGGLLFP